MAIATGSITTSSGSVTIAFGPNDAICRIQTYGTFSGITYALTASLVDPLGAAANNTVIACLDDSTYADDADGSFATQAAGKFLQVNCTGLKSLTLTSSAYTDGTMSVYMWSSPLAVDTVGALTNIAGG